MSNNEDQSNVDNNQAADVIRQKLSLIYNDEPNVEEEIKESEKAEKPSVHQIFMQQLVASGKSVPEIQTEWHQYYLALDDVQKKQVWDEFYASNKHLKRASDPIIQPQQMARLKNEIISGSQYQPVAKTKRSIHKLPKNEAKRLKAREHFKSLLFGLSMGFIVMFIFLFGFFNQIIIAPFIQPARNATNIPVIIGNGAVAPTTDPQVIIPKINVQIPVDYSQTSTDEATIETALNSGVVHYPSTVMPGEIGNTAFFGHSSNNIFNPGKYKFAFVLLHKLTPGDTFYLTYKNTVYIYKVISTKVVSPSDVSVLDSVPGQTATATLITCDPPGTSINRLIVVGQQISPDPTNNTAPAITQTTASPVTSLPGNGPTLWSKFTGSSTGKAILLTLVLLVLIIFFRRRNKKLVR